MYWITGSSYVYPSSRPNREDWTPWPNPKLWLCFTSRAVLAHPLCVIANCYCSTKWLPINPVSLPRSWIKLEKRERGRGDVAIVKHDLDRLQRDHTTVCAYACVRARVCVSLPDWRWRGILLWTGCSLFFLRFQSCQSRLIPKQANYGSFSSIQSEHVGESTGNEWFRERMNTWIDKRLRVCHWLSP